MTAPSLAALVNELDISRFMVNAAPQLIDSNVTFNDPDADFNGATVTLGGYGPDNMLAEDQFGIRDQGAGPGLISVVGHNVNYGGLNIGTFVGGSDGAPLVVTLNANATVAAVDGLLQNLTYGDTSGAPTSDRDLLLNVRDAAGQDFGMVGTGFTELADTANPFNGLGSMQLSFQVAPTLFDFDNDHDLDVISGGDDGAVRVLQNNGTGSFSQLTGSANPFNGFDLGEGSAVAFIDLNGDGFKDAVFTDGLNYTAIKWTNDGDGTFTNAGTLSGFNRGSYNARPAAYDYDNDGDEDLVVGAQDGHLMVFRNNGDGTVTADGVNPFSGIAMPNGSYPAPSFGDLDDDGDLDLILGESNGYVIMYANNNNVFTKIDAASNPFAAQFDDTMTQTGGVWVGGNATPALGDIDGDNDLDLIVGSSYGTTGALETFRNDGIGWGKVIHVRVDPEPYYNGTAGGDRFSCFTADNWIIKGFSGNDDLKGAGGNDTIDGGAGTDKLAGGAGNDTYVVDNAADAITEAATAGTDVVKTSVTYTLSANVENLILLGTAGIDGTGNSSINIINGNSGANTLDGKGGADTMKGGDGNDTYVVDNVSDHVVEASTTGGTDRVNSSVAFTLSANVENLTLVGTANVAGRGNSLINVITGNDAKNSLFGFAGDDTLNGGLGNDQLYGGLGIDKLTGGAGADRFVFDAAPSGANHDNITDFSVADDTIVLDQTIYNAFGVGTLAAGAFFIGSAAHDGDDRIIYNSGNGNIYYDADGSGAGAQVLIAHIAGGLALTNADFLIVA